MRTRNLDPLVAATIDRVPKVELHVHLEGTLEPEMMFALARRNGIDIPYESPEDARAAYRFTDLQSFLDVYYLGTSVLLDERDFEELTFAYLLRARADGVRHVEPFFDPQAHTSRGIDFDTVIGGILSGLDRGREELGISSRLVLSFLRDQSEDDAFAILSIAGPWLGTIAGVGLDSAESGNPPEKFERVFARARRRGLHATAHAGEEGTADDVARTIDTLHTSRIDHGVHAIDDPELVERLVRDEVTLTVCPMSNVRLNVYGSMADSPVKRFLDAGVKVTVNSDDPAYFGGYLSDNLSAIAVAEDLSADDIVTLSRNAIEGSWASSARKNELLAEVGAFVDSPV